MSGVTDEASAGDDSSPSLVQSDVAFPRLNEAQLAAVAAAGTRRALVEGETIFAPGDMDYDLVVVLSGRVAVVDGAGTPSEGVIALHQARQFVGELNLITSEPAYLTAVVEESGEGISLSRDALRALVARDQALGDLILTAFVARRTLLVETGSGVRLIGSAALAAQPRAARVPDPQPRPPLLRRARQRRGRRRAGPRALDRRGRPAAADQRRRRVAERRRSSRPPPPSICGHRTRPRGCPGTWSSSAAARAASAPPSTPRPRD